MPASAATGKSHGCGQLALRPQPGCVRACRASQMPQLQPGQGSLASYHPVPKACMKRLVPTIHDSPLPP